jgi:hypothetical protein
MKRAELQELGYIVRIANVPSILQHGILSHKMAQRVAHDVSPSKKCKIFEPRKSSRTAVHYMSTPIYMFAHTIRCFLKEAAFTSRFACSECPSKSSIYRMSSLRTATQPATTQDLGPIREDWKSLIEIVHLRIGGRTRIRSSNGGIRLKNAPKSLCRMRSQQHLYSALTFRTNEAASLLAHWHPSYLCL